MSRIYDNNYSVQCLYNKFRVTIIDFGKGNIVLNKKLIVLLITKKVFGKLIIKN